MNPTPNTVDLTELQEEVMDVWETNGIKYFEQDTETGHIMVKPHYEDCLNDVHTCVNILGYEKVSQYIAAKNEAEKGNLQLSSVALSQTRTKFFFGDIEFNIDRKNGTTDLWFRPGYKNDSHFKAFINFLKNEYRKTNNS